MTMAMMLTDEMKEELFKQMLFFEHMGETDTYDHRNYCEMSNGAYTMLKILGLDDEYIKWSYGK